MTCYFAKILLLPSAISILLLSQRVLQILGIQLEIALQNAGGVAVQVYIFAPHTVRQSVVVHRNCQGRQLDVFDHGNQLPQVIRDFLTGHIGDDQGQNLGCQVMEL